MTTIETSVDDRISTWDSHGGEHPWTYFPESAKEMIQFFLESKIRGRNLDIGAGWYLYHPNSVVLDLSPRCLERNPASEKVVFDLERVANGEPLPFSNHSFGSVTLVSVWQYLVNRKAIMKELERVVRPGGEVYVINQKYSGLRRIMTASTDPSEIKTEIKEMGYDCIREAIPFGARGNLFESVSVAMPDFDLFGHVPSRIANRRARLRESKKHRTMEGQDDYLKEYALWETRRAAMACATLGSIPITRYSQDFLERVRKVGEEIERLTGKLAVFYEHAPMIRNYLRIPEAFDIGVSLGTLERDGSNKASAIEDDSSVIRRHDIRGIMHQIGFLGFHKESELRDFLEGKEEKSVEKYYLGSMIDFLASTPLNDRAIEVQQKLRHRLIKIEDLDKKIKESRLKATTYEMGADKQRRDVDEFRERKAKILVEGIEVVGTTRFDYHSALPQYYEDTLQEVRESAQRYGVGFGCDED